MHTATLDLLRPTAGLTPSRFVDKRLHLPQVFPYFASGLIGERLQGKHLWWCFGGVMVVLWQCYGSVMVVLRQHGKTTRPRGYMDNSERKARKTAREQENKRQKKVTPGGVSLMISSQSWLQCLPVRYCAAVA
jgi:hypothetical protein